MSVQTLESLAKDEGTKVIDMYRVFMPILRDSQRSMGAGRKKDYRYMEQQY